MKTINKNSKTSRKNGICITVGERSVTYGRRMRVFALAMTMLVSITTIQAQYFSDELRATNDDYMLFVTSYWSQDYMPFAKQQDISELYTPSEITLRNNLFFVDSSDGWLIVNGDDSQSPLKVIPVRSGLGILIIILLGYAIFSFLRMLESPKRLNRD